MRWPLAETFHYISGDDVRAGDHISYHGKSGIVLFIVTEKTGDLSMDWYVDKLPDGGFMIDASGFGNVFLDEPEDEEDLLLISRKSEQ
jgi:hypothetical protein